jgi:hypothetical protein
MHATLMNQAVVSAGTGVTFDGSNDWVDLADVPLGGPMTIAVWVRYHSYKYWSRILEFGDGTGNSNNVIII